MSQRLAAITALSVSLLVVIASTLPPRPQQVQALPIHIAQPVATPAHLIPHVPTGNVPVQKRREMARKVLEVLHNNISSGQLNYQFNPSGESVVLATAGLAFIASGSTIDGGPCQRSLEAICRRLYGIIDAENFSAQPTWGCAQATVFLAELHRTASPASRGDIAPYLARYAQKLIDSQTKGGAWCHTFEDVPNALGYSDFIAVSVMALQGLGMAKREGARVPNETLTRAIGYIHESSSDSMIGYSPRSGQKGMAGPGRTAGGLLALLAVGQEGDPLAQAGGKYLLDSFANPDVQRPQAALNSGHACAQMGVAWAAWWAAANGCYDSFWAGQGELIAGRFQPDGTFTAAPTDGEKNPGRSEIGDFSNAWHALMLTADSGRLQVRPINPNGSGVEAAAIAARNLLDDWPGEAPAALTKLAEISTRLERPNPKEIEAHLDDLIDQLKDSTDAAIVPLLVQLLGGSVTGQFSHSDRTNRVSLELVVGPLRQGRTLGLTLAPKPMSHYDGDIPDKRLSPTTRPKKVKLALRLSEGTPAPDSIEVIATWTFEALEWQQTISVPAEPTD